MRWFTKAWHRGDDIDVASDPLEAERERNAKLRAAYLAHLEALEPDLPAALRPLVSFHRGDAGLTLNDGLVDHWSVDHDQLAFTFVARRSGGDDTTYVRATVTYVGDVELLGGTPEEIRAVLDAPGTEILATELDRTDDGRLEHRLLLWPYFELHVRFRDASLVEAAIDLA